MVKLWFFFFFFKQKYCLFMCYSLFGPVDSIKTKTHLLKPKYVINDIFCFLLLLFASCLLFFPHFFPMSFVCFIKTCILQMGHVPLSQASCPPHLFIPLYLSVVSLRICSLFNTSFLQLFCYCSEMYKGLFSSECRTWLGTPSSRLFSCVSPGACPGDSGSGDQRGGLGFFCQPCLHWFWPGKWGYSHSESFPSSKYLAAPVL